MIYNKRDNLFHDICNGRSSVHVSDSQMVKAYVFTQRLILSHLFIIIGEKGFIISSLFSTVPRQEDLYLSILQ